jgi:hypothetical protein
MVSEKLNKLRQRESNVAIHQQIRHGSPAEKIVLQAAEIKADLIILGTHGRTGLARLLAGSVAEAVLRTARCPVVAVKIPLAREANLGFTPSHQLLSQPRVRRRPTLKLSFVRHGDSPTQHLLH